MEPAKAVCLAFSPSETDRVALLVDIGLGKDLGFPIDFSFFYSPVPDKDQQSGCSIFSEDITGGGGGLNLICFLYRSVQGWLFIGKDHLDPR